ncbi:MAG: hypothetical protein HYX21_03040 [Candidatus Yanofskybacteria bacterium]|nr:hypothetical protein [Candidatus Yanofskybacteria bacterium]
MKKQNVFGAILLLTACFWPAVFGQETPQQVEPSPKPSSQVELVVRGAVVNPEIVGDEFVQVRLEILVLQGRKVNWEVTKKPKTFEPFTLESSSVVERGIPLDSRFKDYNAFEVLIFLSLPDKPPGRYKSIAMPLEIGFTDFQYKDQAVEGKEKKKTVYLKGFTVSKVSLRAELDADRKSLEIGDQFNIILKIVHDPETRVLNLRQPASPELQPSLDSHLRRGGQGEPKDIDASESSVLFLDKVKMPGNETLGVEMKETSESVSRKVTQIVYHLTSFELPPQEFKIGPLSVLYQAKDAENAQSYKTGELSIKLNSVLTKNSQWEGTKSPVFTDAFERFWLITVPYYGSATSAILLVVVLCFWLANFILAARKKTREEILPVQLLLERKSPMPFFIRHWAYLRFNYRKLAAGNRELLENFICHYRLCAGSAEGLSTDRALTLTAGQFKKCTAGSALLLGKLENSLFENVQPDFSENELRDVLSDLARTKLREGLQRFFNRLYVFTKNAVRHS